MINPLKITDYNRNDWDLQEFFFFAVAVAGKKSDQTARKVQDLSDHISEMLVENPYYEKYPQETGIIHYLVGINDEGEADPGWAYDEDFIINFKDPDWALQKLEGIGFNEFDADIDIVLGSDGKGRLLFFGPTPRDMDSVSNMFKEHDVNDYGWENTYPL